MWRSPSTCDHNGVIAPWSATADFALRLSSWRFHERNFQSNSRQQKALENDALSRA
jgi:hypothetical protein